MKKSMLVVCAVVALGGSSAVAQQPQPYPITPPTQQTPPATPKQRPPDPNEPARPPNPDRPMPDSPRSMADVSNSTTVTGCLQTWDSSKTAPATGAGSGAGSAAPTNGANNSASAAEFVLMRVDGSNKNGYLLRTTDSSVSFASHLNHRVTVTGTVEDAAKDMGRATDRQGDQPTGDKPQTDRDASASGRVSAGDAKLPILKVTSIKMVSPTCGS